ncbi:MAG: phosphoribosylformylglycinamidine synthase II [Magnetovibrio sp.]|nr:phosphoribosylformylglycinamidine synthase II [Magnetovibrio sp.]
MNQIGIAEIKEHGLTQSEYKLICEILGREPNVTELGIFSVMWSEHCSYKSSKKWLKILPSNSPRVIYGPGENAGAVDIGDGQAVIFKMESHNHPSYLEPYQGAATGVGGILRDIFTMGARPIANLNSLRFGAPEHHKTRHLVAGVVAGIGGYGNCVGVPTVGGECEFDASYNENILVNAMTVGIANKENIFCSTAKGVGNSVIYVGSKTGRDGIHGATMASAEFSDDSGSKRPTVQVGDPFTEKLLIEACLELMDRRLLVAIQDMGAAGLTSSSFEMASKGGLGVEIELEKVPQREKGMTPYEIMLSESQERMLMIVEPDSESQARKIFEKWELNFAVIGKLTDTGHLILKNNGELIANLPIDPLASASPEYDRPWEPTTPQPIIPRDDAEFLRDPLEVLELLLRLPNLSSKRWVWEQYDHMIMTETVVPPGGDAAIVRIPDTQKGLALTADCTPRYVHADPEEGGRQAVAEAWRNLTAVGSEPLAITDNLNFGNPEKPRAMGQFVGAIKGIADACDLLDFPVVSGNVSLYNETNGKPILPTPTIGGVGLLSDFRKHVTIAFKEEEENIVIVGETLGHLGASLLIKEIKGSFVGPPPPVDLVNEKKNGDFVRKEIIEGNVTACHDISDGGLLVSIAEMAIAANIGAKISPPSNFLAQAWAFGEDQARYVVTTKNVEGLLYRASKAGIVACCIGITSGEAISVSNFGERKVAKLKKLNESWLPSFMNG